MKSLKGYFFILGAALFWGVSATAAKYLITHHFETLLLVQMRMTLSCLILLPVFFIFRRDLLRIKPSDIWDLALLGVVGAAGSNFTYYFAIQETNVATAILMQYLAPLLVLLYSVITKEEKITGIKAGAGIVSLVGCFLAIAGRDISILRASPMGLLFGIGSAFSWGFTNIWLRHLLRKYHVWTCIIYSFIFASIFWLFVNPPWAFIGAGYPADVWGTLLVIAVISVLIPHSLYFTGIRYLTASRAIITATFEPIVAIGSAFLFVNETLNGVQLAGAFLVLGAIALLQIKHEESQVLPPPPSRVPGQSSVHAP